MIPGILEKLGYVAVLAVLHQQARVTWADAQAAVPDFVLAILLMLAFVKDATVDDSHLEHHERYKIVRAVNDARRP